jgi:multiple antibiotic resistance protein
MIDPFYVSAFVTLFVIIDPVGLTPLFMTLTRGRSAAGRRAIAVRSCVTGAAVLILFGAFGEALLGFVGITMPAFRIAGGILLFLTAMDMLFERRTQRRQDKAPPDQPPSDDDPSVFPLGIPLIAGPGAIATMILLTGQAGGDLAAMLVVDLVMLAVIVLTFALFQMAGPVERALGEVGVNVVTRLLGMLLAALSVQFVLDGLRSFGFAGGA